MEKTKFLVMIVVCCSLVCNYVPCVYAGKLMEKASNEYVQEAIREQRTNNIDFAITLYQKAIYANEKNAKALNNLGTAYAQKGLYIKAEENYKRAVEIDPYYSVALMNLALLYAQRKDYDKFFEYWKRAQGLDLYSPFLIDDED